MATRAISCWMNVNIGTQPQAEGRVRLKENYFWAGDEFFKNLTIDKILEMMNRAG